MASGGQDFLRLLANRAVPGARLLDRAGLVRDLLEEMEKRLAGLDELEQRITALERRVEQLSPAADRREARASARKPRRPTGGERTPSPSE